MEDIHGNPTIGEHEGNRYAYFWNGESQTIYRMSLRNVETSNFLTLGTERPFEIEFDYLYFTPWSDNQWFSIDYLVENRYTNMGATATTDPVGYRLSLRVASSTELQYRIMHKANGEWAPVPGSEGVFETEGLIDPAEGVPGTATRVVLHVFGSHQRLQLDGEEMFDLQIDAHPQNAEFNGNTFLQIWSNAGRTRGFDNFTIRQFPHPPIEIEPGDLYWTNDDRIRTIGFDDSAPRTAGVEIGRAIGVALDAARSRLYWAEDTGGKIVSAGIDGSDPKEIATINNGQMMAIDSTRGRLYWAEWRHGLFTSDLDGNDIQQLTDLADYGVESGSSTVTIDLETGDIYWGLATTGEIFRIPADHSSVEPIATLGSNTYGTAIDATRNRLYYTNFSAGTLHYYDLTSQTSVPLLSGLGQPLGVTLDPSGERIYWVERTDGLVRAASLTGQTIGAPETLVEGENSPFGIAVLPTSDSVSFNSWIASFGIPEALQGPEDDPDGDGLSNLLEYAIGGNPSVADSSTRGPAQSRETIGDTEYLTLSVSKNPDATDVNLEFETSSDLAAWTAADNNLVVLHETADTVKVGIPVTGETNDRYFLRLRVSQD
ncbi:MAG TPA: hypothetical protein VK041_07910 [Opitutales bacterium]|nr:hypothetical protein [Opitutales bacterium]